MNDISIESRRAPSATRPPTHRQKQVLDFLVDRCAVGDPPTIRQIASHIGIKWTNAIEDHLKGLERRGLVVKIKSLGQSQRWRPTAVVAVHLPATTPEQRATADALAQAWEQLGPEQLAGIRRIVQGRMEACELDPDDVTGPDTPRRARNLLESLVESGEATPEERTRFNRITTDGRYR